MPNRSLTPLLRYLRKITAPEGNVETTDRQLLARFVVHRDESAFAELLKHHGPMVMGVCRRVLGDWHEAEDAFQATFLVLARKAGSVAKPELLANWLYGVAFRTALKARGLLAQRRAKAKTLMETSIPQTSDNTGIAELAPLLDEELQRLPAKYRAPILLSYFEGKTHEEIARQLGCPRETVSTRMARGRERLRKRLVRHGVVLSSTALAAALSEQAASASVTPALADATVKAAMMFAIGEIALAGTASSPVIALTQGVIKAMMISKLMNAALVILALAVIGTGTGLVWQGLAAGNSPEETQTAANDNQKGQDLKRKDEKEKAIQLPGKIVAEQRAKQWREKLDAPTTIELEPNIPLKEFLGFIAERYGITILIDTRAFRAEEPNEDEAPEVIGDRPVTLPKLVDVKLSTILRAVLSQVGADYYTKDDALIVLPRKQVESGRLFRQPVDAVFKGRALTLALEELQNMTGVSVVLDVRVQDKREPLLVTADLRNVPLETAVRVLADMADLKSVVMQNLIYVTTKENAEVLEADQDKRKAFKVEQKKGEKQKPKEKKASPDKPAPTP